MNNGFDNAHELLRWAQEDIEQFDALSRRFMLNGGYTQFRELDPETGHVALKIRVAPLPDKLRKLATYALWGIKHAADHGMREAITWITGQDPGDVYFPVSTHPNNLRATLLNAKSKFPPALHSLIESFEIYPTGNDYSGGNNEFCALSKLANSTKHAIALSAVPRTVITKATGGGRHGGAKLYWPTPLQSGDNEFTLGVFPDDPEGQVNIDVAAYIGFAHAPTLEGFPAGDFLVAWLNSVCNAIQQLEAQAARVTGRMG